MVWKPSDKANMQISTGLPWTDPFAVRTLEAPEVAMRGVYQLSHAARSVTSPWQNLSELEAWDREYYVNSPGHQLYRAYLCTRSALGISIEKNYRYIAHRA